jgi:hypothetical protein
MSTKSTAAVAPAALRPLSPAELARIIRRAERMRAAYLARLLRSAGRGLARVGRGFLATPPAAARRPAAPRPSDPATLAVGRSSIRRLPGKPRR